MELSSNFHENPDFQPENIVMKNKQITLIDWREDFGGNETVGNIYYDFASLSMHF